MLQPHLFFLLEPLVLCSNLPQFCANPPLALYVCIALSGIIQISHSFCDCAIISMYFFLVCIILSCDFFFFFDRNCLVILSTQFTFFFEQRVLYSLKCISLKLMKISKLLWFTWITLYSQIALVFYFIFFPLKHLH